MNSFGKYEFLESTEIRSSLINSEFEPIDDITFVLGVRHSNEIDYFFGIYSRSFTLSEFVKASSEKEMIYLTAIENLLKQKEYLHLCYQVSNNFITDDEFNEELEKNENKYLIKINDNVESNSIKILVNIINKIKIDLSDEDVSEIFGINHNVVENVLSLKNRNEASLR